MLVPHTEVSREDTTHVKVAHLVQPPLGMRPGSRSWVRSALQLRIAQSTPDRAEVADIVRRRHYLRRWPARPRTLLLAYLGSLGGEGAASMVQVALLPSRWGGLLEALDLHQCSVLTLARSWRADDLGPQVAPDLMCETLRQVVRRLAADWEQHKCTRLQARPRLLATWSDPGVGHDGGLYRGAGAVALGGATKQLWAWALDSALREPLRQYAQARADLRRRCVGRVDDSAERSLTGRVSSGRLTPT